MESRIEERESRKRFFTVFLMGRLGECSVKRALHGRGVKSSIVPPRQLPGCNTAIAEICMASGVLCLPPMLPVVEPLLPAATAFAHLADVACASDYRMVRCREGP